MTEKTTTRPADDQYVCDLCEGTFDKTWTDEEAHAESVQNFGVRGDAPSMAIVCDDCYKLIMGTLNS